MLCYTAVSCFPPRKRPRQARAVWLVDTILCSFWLALERGLPPRRKRLTVCRLAQLSGVAKGSIYQYFSGLESIAYAAYSNHLSDALAAEGELRQGLPSVRQLIHQLIDLHRQALALADWFHRPFCRYHNPYIGGEELVAALRNSHGGKLDEAVLVSAAQFITSMLNHTAAEAPEQFGCNELAQRLETNTAVLLERLSSNCQQDGAAFGFSREVVEQLLPTSVTHAAG
jgi:AcrR family transcriptional regulator